MGVPVRKLPAILHEFTGIEVTQSALTQDALKKSEGAVGNAYQELRTGVATAPTVYTDDTGWRIHGQTAHLMTFDTDQATVFQIRRRHRNEEVRELMPADYAGVMVTDRGKSYDAEELLGVKQGGLNGGKPLINYGPPLQWFPGARNMLQAPFESLAALTVDSKVEP